MDKKIEFVGQVLDNVHGFIPYTAAEKKIIDTQLFKRLQSIKQLSVVIGFFLALSTRALFIPWA